MPDLIPDAVLTPLSYAGSGDAATRLGKLHAEFSKILQVPRIFVRNQGTLHFVSASPADTLLFAKADPQSGRPRYTWTDRGDGVSYGRLQSHE